MTRTAHIKSVLEDIPEKVLHKKEIQAAVIGRPMDYLESQTERALSLLQMMMELAQNALILQKVRNDMASKIKEAKLKTLNMFNNISTDDPDYPLWEKISAYMDGEIAYVIESSLEDGTYVFLGLKDKEKDKEVHYMMEQDSSMGVYIDDREEFDKDWDSGNYEPDGCHYLNPENVELLDRSTE